MFSLTAYCVAAASRRARQLGVLIVLLAVLLGSSSEVMASLCELDVDDTQLMSSVAETERKSPEQFHQRPKISGVSSGQECDARNLGDCDINIPTGEPQAPNAITALRHSAAPAQEQAILLVPPHAPAHYAIRAQGPRAGYYPSIDRPPRS